MMMKTIVRLFVLAIVVLYSCDDPYENSTYQVYNINPVSTYLEENNYTEWVEILKYADLFNAINQATEAFTVFVPENEAIQEFYKQKGVTSIAELGKEYAIDLAKFHIIGDSIALETFVIGGKLESKTLSDDYLSVTFDETTGDGGFNSIYINKEARVTKQAIRVSNGYVYVMDAVLSPLVESVYQRIDEWGGYDLFLEALEQTSWGDSLSIIYDEIKLSYGVTQKQKRNYTVFAVPDEAFVKDGIHSLSDLAAKLGAGSDYKDPENDLFRYIAYHIIKGSYSVFELQNFEGGTNKKLWDTEAAAVMEISLEDDDEYYINYGGKEVKVQFVDDMSDIQARNGVLHQVDGYMPIWESVIPVQVKFDFANYSEVASYIASYGISGQAYQTVGSAEYRTEVTNLSCYEVYKSPAGTKTTSYNFGLDYFTTKSGNAWKDCYYGDQLILNLGLNGHVSMKTPALIAGKYKVTLGFAYATSLNFLRTLDNSQGGLMEFSFDGEHKTDIAPYPNVPANTLGCYECVTYQELEFTKTGTHTFKILVKDSSASTNSNFRIQLDYLLFDPIIED